MINERKEEDIPIVFTPDNEPYLGRNLLFHFDQIIRSVMDRNTATALASHGRTLSEHQVAACQLIPQAMSIMLSIRELIRQGYLFGGHVLLRAMIERSAILLYLHLYPEQIECWKRGWQQKEAPGLAKMLDDIQKSLNHNPRVAGRDLTAHMNSLLHAKPDSAPWNLVSIGDNRVGHAVSKILNRPDLCDELCVKAIPWGVVVLAMMGTYFSEGLTDNEMSERNH